MNDENNIRVHFTELRRREEQDAPAFGAVWSAAGARLHRERRQRFWRVSAAAGVLAASGICILLVFERTPIPSSRPVLNPRGGSSTGSELPWRSVVLVSEWRAPTDFLLAPPLGGGQAAEFSFNSGKPKR